MAPGAQGHQRERKHGLAKAEGHPLRRERVGGCGIVDRGEAAQEVWSAGASLTQFAQSRTPSGVMTLQPAPLRTRWNVGSEEAIGQRETARQDSCPRGERFNHDTAILVIQPEQVSQLVLEDSE